MARSGTGAIAGDPPAEIHATAIVDSGAEIGACVRVGPYAVIGGDVKIGDRTSIGSHAVIEGSTVIGCDNQISQFASVGAPPQDLKYRGEPTRLVIGDRNVIREFATVHRGTPDGGAVTTIGDDCMLMAYSHVAHDCLLGSHVVMANCATLAGHAAIGDHVIVGGLVAVHQHVRVGESAMLGGGAMVAQDVVPYCIAVGDRARLAGVNVIGLKRRGFAPDEVSALRRAYKAVFHSPEPFATALDHLEAAGDHPEPVSRFLRFIRESSRGVIRAGAPTAGA